MQTRKSPHLKGWVLWFNSRNTHLTSLQLVGIRHHGHVGTVNAETKFHHRLEALSPLCTIYVVPNFSVRMYCRLSIAFLGKVLINEWQSCETDLEFSILCSNCWLKIEVTALWKSSFPQCLQSIIPELSQESSFEWMGQLWFTASFLLVHRLVLLRSTPECYQHSTNSFGFCASFSWMELRKVSPKQHAQKIMLDAFIGWREYYFHLLLMCYH